MNAFSTWRSGGFKTVVMVSDEVTMETNSVVEEHTSKVVIIKK
jgi:hypothetical protein